MARKRFTPEQIIGMLREAEVRLSQGEKVKGICRSLGITEQTYYRWRKDYGGMKISNSFEDFSLSGLLLRKYLHPI